MTTTSKFKIGDKVRIKQGLTGFNTGISDKDLSKIYENNLNVITDMETLIDGTISYRIENIKNPIDLTYYFLQEELEPISEEEINLSSQVETLVKETLNKLLNEPYKVKVKYHDSSMPKFKQIEKGNWIDCRVIKGGKITHPDGTKEPLEWKVDENGTYYIEYKKGDFMMLPLGFSINQGKGYEINLVPRSSTFKNYGIIQTNHFAVGDDTFVGNNDMYHYPCYALRNGRINLYDRICQMKINKAMPQIIFNEVEDMESEDRGGFGSTGVK